MNQPLQSIVQHLFQVTSLDDVSRQRLESFVVEYPSFGIGHYLLSHKLRTEDPDRYRDTTQRTCLYFSNPFWLEWQLTNSPDSDGPAHETVAPGHSETSVLPVEEPHTIESQQIDSQEVEIPGDEVQSAQPQSAEPQFNEPQSVESLTVDIPGETIEEATVAEPPAAPTETIVEEPADSNEVSAADQLLLSIEEARGLRDSLQKISEDFTVDAVPEQQPIQDQEVPFVLDEPQEAPAPLPENPEPIAAVNAAEPQEAPTEPPPAPTPEPVPAPPTPEPIFEPYHTIDYFASQGIRLKLDENPADALGKQLKSFTDWLKIMRRLPQKDRDSSVPDRAAEQAVQNFAAHSIQSKDIVTETMAEVLIKQGMRDRARVIYEKLSLLNPDKKAYFAAKIEQINIP
ncbi:MAG TPA: hypothetical protein VGQ51_00190 [Puia sp.]|jgi:hypothetical protein|nr:hypothetical protein [Puia sp.]